MFCKGSIFFDLIEGLRGRFWWALSLHDIRGRYRRTFFGPWWLTLGTGIALTSIGVVWSSIFKMEMATLFPYLSSGYVVWMMLASFLTEGCSTFTNGISGNLQHHFVLPKTVHAYRLVSRSVLIFLHNVIIFVIGAVVFSVPVNAWTLLAIPGFFVLVLTGVWLSLLLGVLGARYRDLEPLISAFLTLLFLISPIFWHVDLLGERRYLAEYNPITHYIAVLREPLLGHPVPALSWVVVLTITAAGCTLAMLLLARYRNRLAYWL